MGSKVQKVKHRIMFDTPTVTLLTEAKDSFSTYTVGKFRHDIDEGAYMFEAIGGAILSAEDLEFLAAELRKFARR